MPSRWNKHRYYSFPSPWTDWPCRQSHQSTTNRYLCHWGSWALDNRRRSVSNSWKPEHQSHRWWRDPSCLWSFDSIEGRKKRCNFHFPAPTVSNRYRSAAPVLCVAPRCFEIDDGRLKLQNAIEKLFFQRRTEGNLTERSFVGEINRVERLIVRNNDQLSGAVERSRRETCNQRRARVEDRLLEMFIEEILLLTRHAALRRPQLNGIGRHLKFDQTQRQTDDGQRADGQD